MVRVHHEPIEDATHAVRAVRLRAPLHRRGEPGLRGWRGRAGGALGRGDLRRAFPAPRAPLEEGGCVRRGLQGSQGRRPHRPHRLRHRPLRGPDEDAGARRARGLPRPGVRGQGQDLPAGEPHAAHPEVHRRRPGQGPAGQAGHHELGEDEEARQGAAAQDGGGAVADRRRAQGAPGPRLLRAGPVLRPVRGGLRVRGDAGPGQGHRGRAGGHAEAACPWTGWSAATWATARRRWPCAPPSRPRWTASRWRCWCPPRCWRSSTTSPSRSASRTTPSPWRSSPA